MSILFAQLITLIRLRPLFCAALVLAAVLAGLNYPLWQRRLVTARDHETVRKKGEFMVNALANRTQFDADLLALREALGQIEQHLVDERSMEVNLGYFYRLERTTRVRLLRLNQLVATAPPAGSPYKAVPFSMHMTGSYKNAMAFIRGLETGPRIVRVRECNVERSAPDNSDLVLDLTVDVLAKI
ncbi:MAG TPA: type 4a pilus biogenesis protein PilO [Opitutaceae bacterium]|nr:type 4a pilus biogenesis protein PilO [Opitutaceae bacterium]